MAIEQFDDAKMRECLQEVQSGCDDMNKLCQRYKLKNKYQAFVDTEDIEFCLDMKNSASDRNIRFNKIYLDIDTLLTRMDNMLHFIISRVGVDDDTDKATLHIKTADDLLNAVLEEMESRKKEQKKEAESEKERLRWQKSHDGERKHGVPTRALLRRLSSFSAPDEKGVEIIQTMFRSCEELSKYKIDERVLMHPEKYETRNGFSHLLIQMGLTLGWVSEDRKLKANLYGPLTTYMNQPQKACEKFSETLRSNDVKIFTWIEILETVLKSNEIHLLFAIMDSICDFMILFDIKIPTKTWELHDRMLNRVYNIERNTLFYNFRISIGYHHILRMDYNLDKTFKQDCYFENKYLCTVTHNESDIYTGSTYPGTKNYNLVVTWSDGRQEDWTLSVFTWNTGEKKGQLREFPEGQKYVREFIFTGKIHSKKES
jgi:hypothetical protein